MAFLIRDGVRLHYQVAGEGPPLVLHHGFGGSWSAWRYFGFVQQLKDRYQLIMPDARGHGLSGKPHDLRAYSMSERIDDVLAILDELRIERAHFMGYSMGGLVAYGLARREQHRLRSLIIGAAHPYEDHSWDVFAGIDGSNPAAFIDALETALGERLSDDIKANVLNNDLWALSAAAKRRRPSMEHILPGIALPCLLYCGRNDARHAAVERCAAALPAARFASLPGIGHFEGMMRSDLVLPHLLPFLAQQ
ncbi:MAG TPA: alpha/beta hydrolase [Herbaspirillum sp.]|jgi:pimeloyl-ACP methyl ester carboxylesterase